MPQACQVSADPGLGLADRSYQLAHGSLLLLQQLKDLQTRRISQDPKKAGRGGAINANKDRGIHIWKTGYHFLLYQAAIGFQIEEKIDDGATQERRTR